MKTELELRQDFDKCVSQRDFEEFVIKYNSEFPNHELVRRAKSNIVQRADHKKELSRWPLFILGGIVAIGAAVGLIMLGMSREGASATTTYHGEHGDYRMTNFDSMLGPIGLFGGIAVGILGLYLIGKGISMAKETTNI